LEVAVVWLMFLADAVAMFVTYSRVPASELYHVSHSGLAGGASRVLVFSNFSVALVAIAVLLVLADRQRGWIQGIVAAGVGLCAAVFWPGVVDQANLDAKPVNAVAAVGVLVAFALTVRELRRPWGLVRPRAWQTGDRLRMVVAGVALFLALPWLAAELGFFLNGVPLVGWLFQTGRYLPTANGLPPFPPAVHHGHHHGLDGTLLLLTAVLLSRLVSSLQNRRLRLMVGAYLALMASYGVGNIANDFWIEQVWKRRWTTWQIPSVLRPDASVAWGVIVICAVVLYAVASRWGPRGRNTGGEGALLLDV
jgi:hypothetical protein